MHVTAQERVNPVIVPDYGNYVEVKDEVWLSLIRKRVREGAHKSLASLLKDVEQLAENARAYNTPGHGKLGSPCEPLPFLQATVKKATENSPQLGI